VPGVTSTVRTGISYAKATVSTTSRATQSVEIQTDFTWPPDCKFPILCSSVFQPLAGGHSKVSDVALSAVQTDSVDSVFVEAGGQPPALLEKRTSQTGNKLRQAEKKTINQRPRPVPGVPLAKKKTNRPARSDSSDASIPSKPCVPQRLPKGTADVIKLANRYSSLEEMSMDLGRASHSSPNIGKHK